MATVHQFPTLTSAHVGSRRLRSVRPAPPELHRQVADLDEWLNRPSKRIGFDPPIPLWLKLYLTVAAVAAVGVWFL